MQVIECRVRHCIGHVSPPDQDEEEVVLRFGQLNQSYRKIASSESDIGVFEWRHRWCGDTAPLHHRESDGDDRPHDHKCKH